MSKRIAVAAALLLATSGFAQAPPEARLIEERQRLDAIEADIARRQKEMTR